VLILDRGLGDERLVCGVIVRQQPTQLATHLFVKVVSLEPNTGESTRQKVRVGDFLNAESVKNFYFPETNA
jgi:hypothetical protein